MVEAGAVAGSTRQRENIQPFEGKMNYSMAGKPLDFSFMRIQTVGRKLN